MRERFLHRKRWQAFKLPDEEKKGFKISAAEKKMAKQLVESTSGEWNPESWHDDYRAALLEYIEQKARKGKVATEPAKPRKKAQVIDLTERLRKSIEQSSGGKRGGRKKTAARKRSGAKRKAASR
ncbi:MAG TPA: hypothetical protein VFX38_00435 [Gammaproteobacteria bacterium]|nr:hypothetical protein [Gammaproteobacteria bacterium]